LTAFLSAVLQAPDSWRLMLLSERGLEKELRERISRGRKLQIERVSALTTEQFASRGIEDAERKGELIAHTIVAAAESAAALMLEHPRRWKPEELAEQLARLIVRGATRL
jgi:hypothetical protein